MSREMKILKLTVDGNCPAYGILVQLGISMRIDGDNEDYIRKSGTALVMRAYTQSQKPDAFLCELHSEPLYRIDNP